MYCAAPCVSSEVAFLMIYIFIDDADEKGGR